MIPGIIHDDGLKHEAGENLLDKIGALDSLAQARDAAEYKAIMAQSRYSTFPNN